jgi:hypothetical protein
LADSFRQSIDNIPENITYFYGDDNLESTGRTRLQVNTVNERLGVVDIAHSKTAKALRHRHVKDLSLNGHCTSLDLERAYYLLQRYVCSGLLILLKLELSQT